MAPASRTGHRAPYTEELKRLVQRIAERIGSWLERSGAWHVWHIARLKIVDRAYNRPSFRDGNKVAAARLFVAQGGDREMVVPFRIERTEPRLDRDVHEIGAAFGDGCFRAA